MHPWNSDLSYSQRFQPSEVTADELDNLLRQGGSHDKVIWMGPGRTAEENHQNVRVQTKVRGRLDVSSIKYLQWMSSWKKTVFCLRENRWSFTEREVPAWTKNNLVPGTRLVVFLQAPCDAEGAAATLRGENAPKTSGATTVYQESEDGIK